MGAMGLVGFRLLLNDPRFAKVPKILETPKGDNDEMDVVNLKALRDLIR
jgi:deoxyribonuclease-4